MSESDTRSINGKWLMDFHSCTGIVSLAVHWSR